MKNRKIVCQSDIRLWNFCEEKKQMLRKKPASTSAVSGSGPAGTQTSQRKPWKPGFPPPYPHTLPRPVIGTLHVSSANSNTSSVFHPFVSLLNWHWYKNWKVHVSSTRRKGRLHRQSSGPGAFWNDDLALCTVHSLHTSRVSIPRICTNQLPLFRCNALQCMAGTSQVPQLGLLSLILKSIIRSLMPKAPIGACIRV